MKELDIKFKGSGEVSNFTFRQVASSIHGYVYEITDDNENRHYETFERKEQEKSDTVIAGMIISYEAKVLYPKSNSFGAWAWCYKNKESAMRRFNELNGRPTLQRSNKATSLRLKIMK